MLDDADGRLYVGRSWAEHPEQAAAAEAARAAAGASLSAIDLLIGVLRRQLWAILLPLTLMPLLAGVAITRMPTLYTATGTLLYDPAGYAPDVLQSILKSDPTTDTVLASQSAILASQSIADRVAVGLDLGRQPDFQPPRGLGRDAAAHAVDLATMKATRVAAVGASRAFAVSFTARNPVLAAAAVNRIMDLYLADQLALKTAALDAANAWMQKRAAVLAARVLAGEAAITRYRAAHGLTQGVQAGIGTEEISVLGEELMRAENDLAQASARQSVAAGSDATVAQNVVAMRLAQAQVEAQLQAARTRLGPNHPTVRALEEQLASLTAAQGGEVSAVRQSIAGSADAAAARLAGLRQTLAMLRAESVAEAAAEGPLDAMTQGVEATRKLLQSLLGQMDETAQQAAIQTPDARILSRAEPPVTPSSPRAHLLLAAALLAGAALGGIIAWAREVARLTLRTEAEVRASLGLPVVGTIPNGQSALGRQAQPGAARAVAVALAEEEGPGAQQLDALRARLRATLGDPRVVAITATRPGEGKSTLALALGRRAARCGERVLLIDCDRGRANLTRMLGATAAVGLAELGCEGHAEPSTLLMREAGSTLVFLPAGREGSYAPDGVFALLAREGWRRLFDLILLDTPPLLASGDALTLSEQADATLFCLRWHHTPRRLALHARSLLRPGGRGLGVVLTRIKPRARALCGFPEAEIGRHSYAGYARR